jgi:hypothetical protein
MKNLRFLFLFGSLCWNSFTHAQTQQQWAQTVNWDGVSHWSKYINMLPAHMGPNALPVPPSGNGHINSHSFVGATLQLHSAPGDHSQSIVLYGNYCLVKDVISFDASYIPAEYYTMSDTLKRERHVYYEFYNDKKARGDLILNVNIHLLKKLDKQVQLALQLGYRYPSSNGFGAARFTDDMGYYIDVSAGKPLGNSGLKFIAMAGFYCWQVEKGDLRQDDAFLYSGGFEWNKNGWNAQATIAGYVGYLENQGDKPCLARAAIEKKMHHTGILLKFQQGLHDYKYTTIEFGAKHYFN